MRFIGSKVNLLTELDTFIAEHCPSEGVFCDIFSGTGTVAKHFKSKYSVISNDLMRFSYVIQSATVELDRRPKFEGLKSLGITEPLDFLNSSALEFKQQPFIRDNFSPFEGCERMYLSVSNASRIDFIRQTLNEWFDNSLIDLFEFNYLLACLIESIPFVSNIAGTYGAFLKHWDKRALQAIKLVHLPIKPNAGKNKSYNLNSQDLLQSINGDILYMDPPYNGRQYLPNYHLLETVACYDYPELKGKTGLRPYPHQKSKFCSKRTVANALEETVSNADFKHIVLSYSSEGLLQKKEILEILLKYSCEGSVVCKEIPYRRYKHTKTSHDNELVEYIFYMEKSND